LQLNRDQSGRGCEFSWCSSPGERQHCDLKRRFRVLQSGFAFQKEIRHADCHPGHGVEHCQQHRSLRPGGDEWRDPGNLYRIRTGVDRRRKLTATSPHWLSRNRCAHTGREDSHSGHRDTSACSENRYYHNSQAGGYRGQSTSGAIDSHGQEASGDTTRSEDRAETGANESVRIEWKPKISLRWNESGSRWKLEEGCKTKQSQIWREGSSPHFSQDRIRPSGRGQQLSNNLSQSSSQHCMVLGVEMYPVDGAGRDDFGGIEKMDVEFPGHLFVRLS
jgi:hypothetical protein